jgi:hypothetical protein
VTRRSLLAVLVAALVVAAVVAGCGGSAESSEPATVTVVETVADTGVPADTGAPADTGVPADTGAVAPGPEDLGDLTLQYVPADDETLQAYTDFLAGSELLEGILADVNASVALPQDVIVSVETTGDDPSPFYTPEVPAIVMPPEWLAFSDQIFSNSGFVETTEDAQNLLLASTAFVFYHELGHMLIDQLGIPATGKEEDAVDQLATVIVAEQGEDAGYVALAGGVFFGLLGADREAFEAADFWDAHSLDEQRFFNIICWVYGSDPEQYADVAVEAGIPEDRLASCSDEYEQIRTSWETLLAPYVTG